MAELTTKIALKSTAPSKTTSTLTFNEVVNVVVSLDVDADLVVDGAIKIDATFVENVDGFWGSTEIGS